jgi:hypothetical protein
MAIAKGINGTFFPYQEIEEVEPIYFRKFKKTVSVDNAWEDRVFYEITRFPMGRQNTIDWLLEHYHDRVYAGTWWTTVNGIVMNEKIYTHYKLME